MTKPTFLFALLALTSSVFGQVPEVNTRKAPLVNQSTRGFINSGEEILIAGFVIKVQTNVLIRGAGPALRKLGVADAIATPEIILFQSKTVAGQAKQEVVARNSNWVYAFPAQSDPGVIEDVMASVGAFAFERGSSDAALYLQLEPGIYTVHMQGLGAAKGVGLAEVFLMPSDTDPFSPALRSGAGFAPMSLTLGDMGVRLSMTDSSPLSFPETTTDSAEPILRSYPATRVVPILPNGRNAVDSDGWTVSTTAERTGANTMLVTDSSVSPLGMKVTRTLNLTFAGLNHGSYTMEVFAGQGEARGLSPLATTTGSFVFDRLMRLSPSGSIELVQ